MQTYNWVLLSNTHLPAGVRFGANLPAQGITRCIQFTLLACHRLAKRRHGDGGLFLVVTAHRPSKIACLCCLLWFPILSAAERRTLRFTQAESTRFVRFTRLDGLAHQAVAAIHQDRQGFLWFGTQNGLQRFDGDHFLTFQHDPHDQNTPAHNVILAICEDEQGLLWLGTHGGLNRFDPVTQTFKNYQHHENDPRSLSYNDIRTILPTATGLWIGTLGGGLDWFDFETEQFTHYREQAGTANEAMPLSVRSLTLDDDQVLWAASSRGLLRLAPGDPQLTLVPVPLAQGPQRNIHAVRTVTYDGSDVLWVGTDQGLFRYQIATDQWQKFPLVEPGTRSQRANVVNHAMRDRNGRLWLATRDGLAVFDPRHQEVTRYNNDPSNPHSLSSNETHSVLQDQAGAIWIGTWTSGVNRSNPGEQQFQRTHIGDHSGLSHNSVYNSFRDHNGTQWLATDEGLNRRDPGSDHFKTYRHDPDNPRSISHDLIFSITSDVANHLWIGTGYGLNRFEPESETFVRYLPGPEGLPGRVVNTLYVDRRAHLWLGFLDGGMARYLPENDRFQHYPYSPNSATGPSDEDIKSFAEDNQDRLWIACSGGGLNMLDRSRRHFTVFRHQPDQPYSLSHDKIACLRFTKRGELWVGTSGGGLNRMRGIQNGQAVFEHFTARDGLGSNAVGDILEDERGRLWLSHTEGLACLDPDTGAIRNFTPSDGVFEPGFWITSGFRDRNGVMYFGGSAGLTFFHPAQIQLDAEVPNVVPTALFLNNREVQPNTPNAPLQRAMPYTNRLTFNYRQSLFSITFAAPNALHFDDLHYQYRLEGFDQDWLPADNRARIATYTNLPPGNYIFSVRAAHRDGAWQQTPTKVAVKIRPAPWQTWWAYTLYGLCLTAGCARFVQAQREKVIHQQQVNDRLRRLDQLKDDFLANTSHELRTPINGIIGLAESLLDGARGDLPGGAKRDLKYLVSSGRSLATLIDDILDFSKLKTRSLQLDPRPQNLAVIADVVLALLAPAIGEKDLKMKNEVPDDCVVFADEHRLQQILFYLVGNAVKFTYSGSVRISAKREGDWVRVHIVDTGIGIAAEHLQSIFESFEQVGPSLEREHGGAGLGLTITKELVDLHGGTISVQSEANQGADFHFTLPACDEVVTGASATGLGLPAVYEDDVDEPEITYEPGAFKILVVDDERINRDILKNHLTLRRYAVETAVDGVEALRKIEERDDFDLVLLDIMMPRLSGYEVCRAIRKQYAAHQLPVIYLTAKNQPGDVAHGFETGANDYLTKPIAKAELLARVQTHLQLRDTNRHLERKVQDRTHDIELLAQIGREITAHLSVTGIERVLAAQLSPILDTESLGIGLYDVERGTLRFDHSDETETEEAAGPHLITVANSNDPAALCIQRREEILIGDIAAVYRHEADRPPTVNQRTLSLLCFPLTRTQEGVIGLLRFRSSQREAYSARHVALLRSLAAYIAIALENTAAFESIREKNEEIQRRQAQLVQTEKMSSLVTFTAGVAHEFKNPLNFINNLAQVSVELVDELTEVLAEQSAGDAANGHRDQILEITADLQENARIIREHGVRANAVIDAMTEMVRDVAPRRTRVALNRFVREYVNIAFQGKRVRNPELAQVIVFDLADGLPKIRCAPQRLARAVIALVNNALEAVLEREHPNQGCIQITTGTHNGGLELRVRDNGPGFDESQKSKLFTPFFTTKPTGSGNIGLGLSNAYDILVIEHGGDLSLNRRDGWTEAAVFLPLKPKKRNTTP